tara:strand:- start:62 stop:262 length:201 start_codon:yes stop_codon:yes gene_type:complete
MKENIDKTIGETLNTKLLEILVCPVSRSTLKYIEKDQELISEAAGLAFPVRNGIPILLMDEARKLE